MIFIFPSCDGEQKLPDDGNNDTGSTGQELLIPKFVSYVDDPSTRDINSSDANDLNAMGKVKYFMNSPMISRFSKETVSSDNTYDSKAGNTSFTLNVINEDNNITRYQGSDGERFSINIVLDNSQNRFSFEQVYIDTLINESGIYKVMSIATGEDVSVRPDGGINGDFRTIFLMMKDGESTYYGGVYKGHLYSNESFSGGILLEFSPIAPNEGLLTFDKAEALKAAVDSITHEFSDGVRDLYWTADGKYWTLDFSSQSNDLAQKYADILTNKGFDLRLNCNDAYSTSTVDVPSTLVGFWGVSDQHYRVYFTEDFVEVGDRSRSDVFLNNYNLSEFKPAAQGSYTLVFNDGSEYIIEKVDENTINFMRVGDESTTVLKRDI